ncbi:MAG: hypothetical protein WCA46_16360 [Actinocatenispora sp.]
MPDTATPELSAAPFHAALRRAIAARGLSLERLRAKLAERGLHVGVTTLSYWQRGLRRPERQESLTVVTALEELLGLPVHSLTVLLGPPRPRGGAVRYPPGLRRYTAVLPRPDEMAPLLDRLDMDAASRVHVACELATVELGAAREMRRTTVTRVVRAHQSHADRAVAILWQDPGGDVDRVDVRATQNCRLGRVSRDPGAGLVAAELLFDLSLNEGETRVLSYEVVDDSGTECREFVRALCFPAEQYVLQIRFHPDALPVRCHRFVARGVDAPEQETADLTLDCHRAVHLVMPQARPGAVGIRWEWH